MTIFDVLKYPLDDKATLEQLKAVPSDVHRMWVKECWARWPDISKAYNIPFFREYEPAIE